MITLTYKNDGFTLLETAIVIAIFGLLVGAGLALYRPIDEAKRESVTKEHLEAIADAISNFTLRNNRIPCPALPDGSGTEPFGAELGSGATGGNAGSCTAADEIEGIVPFRSLGLNEDIARDAWDRFITYRVSPAFAEVTASDTVHRDCRTSNWIEAGINENPEKARFCCADVITSNETTDIRLNDVDGNRFILARDGAGANYGDVDNETTAAGNSDAVVYILVSHGNNGVGYFTGAGPATRYTAEASGTIEDENGDGDAIFQLSPRITTDGNNYFDDILLFRTQNGVMSDLGVDSCARP